MKETLNTRLINALVLCIVLLLCTIRLIVTTPVQAAGCSNTSNFGSATWTVNVPEAGQYVIWSRINTPNTTGAQFQLDIDGGNCWQVGGGQQSNTWTWVNWYGGNQAQKITHNFTSSGTHTLKAIGLLAGVQIDRIILLGNDEKCSDNSTTPTGNGDNCGSAPAALQTGTTQEPSNVITSGTTTPTIVAQNSSNIAETTYIVDGKVVQTSKGAAPLNTAKLANGAHSVQTVVTLKDGQKITETQTIQVENKPNLIKIIGITLLTLAVFSLVGLMVWIFISKRTSRKYRQIHEIQSLDNIEPIVVKPQNEGLKND